MNEVSLSASCIYVIKYDVIYFRVPKWPPCHRKKSNSVRIATNFCREGLFWDTESSMEEPQEGDGVLCSTSRQYGNVSNRSKGGVADFTFPRKDPFPQIPWLIRLRGVIEWKIIYPLSSIPTCIPNGERGPQNLSPPPFIVFAIMYNTSIWEDLMSVLLCQLT